MLNANALSASIAALKRLVSRSNLQLAAGPTPCSLCHDLYGGCLRSCAARADVRYDVTGPRAARLHRGLSSAEVAQSIVDRLNAWHPGHAVATAPAL